MIVTTFSAVGVGEPFLHRRDRLHYVKVDARHAARSSPGGDATSARRSFLFGETAAVVAEAVVTRPRKDKAWPKCADVFRLRTWAQEEQQILKEEQ